MQAKIGHGFLNSDKDWRVKQQLTYFFILIHTVVQYILISNIKGSYKSNLITLTGLFCTLIFDLDKQGLFQTLKRFGFFYYPNC